MPPITLRGSTLLPALHVLAYGITVSGCHLLINVGTPPLPAPLVTSNVFVPSRPGFNTARQRTAAVIVQPLACFNPFRSLPGHQ